MSVDKNDWRLTNQINYLYGKELELKKYEPYREDWEHDHCAFCWETINTNSPEAYATKDNYHWICQECYEDFKEMFQWSVSGEISSAEKDISKKNE